MSWTIPRVIPRWLALIKQSGPKTLEDQHLSDVEPSSTRAPSGLSVPGSDLYTILDKGPLDREMVVLIEVPTQISRSHPLYEVLRNPL